MIVRRAEAKDVPALVGLWREMWDLHARLDPRMAATPIADVVMASWFRDHLEADRSIVYVAQEDSTVVGYALGMILENPPVVAPAAFGYISEIAITEAHRLRGVGGMLLDAMHAWFHVSGMTHVEVSVSTRNAASRAFWRKHGYSEFLERLRREL